jgi:hypothetical protein
MPWYVFLFVGAFDYGFYSYALIATQDAARIAGMYCSTSTSTAADATTACSYSLDQVRNLPNVGTALTTCSASPLVVTASVVNGADGTTNGDTQVSVTYTTPQLIPIPGLFPGKLTIAKTVQMKIR